MNIKIPKNFPVQPLKPGQEAKDKVTCGTCGLSWDDAIGTAWTPAPAGRCPFEYFHKQVHVVHSNCCTQCRSADHVTADCPELAVDWRAVRLGLPYGDPAHMAVEYSLYEQAKAEQKHMQLTKGGLLAQAEAIGLHYTRVAKMAQFLHVMSEVYKNSQSDGLKQLMSEHIEDIKRAHLEDFGLVLAWTPQNPGNLPAPEG